MQVRTSGPLFEGKAPKVVEEFIDTVTSEYGDLVMNEVKNKSESFKESGRFERSIQTNRQSNSVNEVSSGVIYGPWLEGVSSRNSSTRFKGYSVFRRTAQEMNRKAGGFANELFRRRFLGRMN